MIEGDDIVDWFNALSTPAKAILSLALVLLLVVLAGLALRKIAGGRLRLPGQAARTRQPRLGIVDIFELDRQRQLVLLRRDNVEHLVMIGGPNDLVVEASIVRGAVRAQVPAPASEPEVAPPTSESKPPVRVVAPVASVEPALDLPQPPPPARNAGTAPRTTSPGADSVLPAAALAGAAAIIARPASAAPPLTKPAEQPASAPAVSAQSSPAGLDGIESAFELELANMTAQAAASATATKPVEVSAGKPLLEPIAPSPSARASRDELDDMTRQLQEALKRPFSGVKPGPQARLEPALEDVPALPVHDAARETEPRDTEPTPQPPPAPADAPSVRVGAFEPVAPQPAVPSVEPRTPPPILASLPDLERELASVLAMDAAAAGIAPQAVPTPAAQGGPAERGGSPEPVVIAEQAQVDMPPVAPQPGPEQRTMNSPKASAATAKPAATMAPATIPAKVEPATPTVTPEADAPAALELAPDAPVDDKGAPEPQDADKRSPEKQPPEKRAVEPSGPDTAGQGKTGPAAPDAASDPFSVDAIEAEFARLLNRGAPPRS